VGNVDPTFYVRSAVGSWLGWHGPSFRNQHLGFMRQQVDEVAHVVSRHVHAIEAIRQPSR